MVPDRKLTPEEKEKIRDYQTREILRRRGNPEGAAEAEAEVEAEVAARLASGGAKCPDCGTPYRQRRGPKRCYHCPPKDTARPRGPVVVPVTEPAVVVTPEPEVIEHVADVGNMVGVGGNGELVAPEYSVPSRNIDEPVPDHLRGATKMIGPDPIAALRRVVDALDGLDADAVRWVLRSAARLPRPDPSGVT